MNDHDEVTDVAAKLYAALNALCKETLGHERSR
jgi:hypothetical protein